MLEVGTLFILTWGEDEDYEVKGLFRVKKACDFERIKKEYINSVKDETKRSWSTGMYLFASYLQDYIEPVQCSNLCLDYCGIEDAEMRPINNIFS